MKRFSSIDDFITFLKGYGVSVEDLKSEHLYLLSCDDTIRVKEAQNNIYYDTDDPDLKGCCLQDLLDTHGSIWSKRKDLYYLVLNGTC